MATAVQDRPPSPLPLSVSPAQLTVLVVCVVSVYFVANFYEKSLQAYRISQRATEVHRDIDRLEADIQRLKAEIAYYQTDEYVEVMARNNLSLVKPGDRPVIVLPAEPTPAAEQAQGAEIRASPTAPATTHLPRDPELGYIPSWVAVFFAPRQ